MSRLKNAVLTPNATLKDAIRLLNESSLQIALVLDADNKLLGTITDGDIRRALLVRDDLTIPVSQIMFRKPRFLFAHERDRAAAYMREQSIAQLPILSTDMQVVDLIVWRDVEDSHSPHSFTDKENLVFILAGGKGTRLRPVTSILPKPLIPLGEMPIIEYIMTRFERYGFNKFCVSVNYKAEMIKLYFAASSNGTDARAGRPNREIDFVTESEFLGTAGSLSMIRGRVATPVIVTNCDVLLDIDIDDLLGHHIKSGNAATMVGSVRHVSVPYGVIQSEGGLLTGIEEKPEYDLMINTGIYVLNQEIVNLIPDGTRVDMPDLLLKARDAGMRIGVYPASSELIDIGHWDEYKAAVEKLNRPGFMRE